jgi:hypothetical protein
MSQKFSFLIIVESDGSLKTKAFKREDAQDGLNEFSKVRDQGKEAHFFHCPKADKRCKSSEDREALERFTSPKQEIKADVVGEMPTKSSKKSSKSEFKSLDLE